MKVGNKNMYIKAVIEDQKLFVNIIKNNEIIFNIEFDQEKAFKMIRDFISSRSFIDLTTDNANEEITIYKEAHKPAHIVIGRYNYNIENENIFSEIIKITLKYLFNFNIRESVYEDEKLVEITRTNDENNYFITLKYTCNEDSNTEKQYITFIIKFKPDIEISIIESRDIFIVNKITHESNEYNTLIHIGSYSTNNNYPNILSSSIN